MNRGSRDYPIPSFLSDLGISQDTFGSWLDRISAAHVRRDRKRIKEERIEPKTYRQAIHRAVTESEGNDYYTGEKLDWTLLQHFAGKKIESRDEGKIPTVDHENLSATNPIFRICSMRTNKCMSDFTIDEMVSFCERFLDYQKTKGRTRRDSQHLGCA